MCAFGASRQSGAAAFDRYSDDYFLRKTPGLYPDVMQPVGADGRLIAPASLKALMVEVDTGGKVRREFTR